MRILMTGATGFVGRQCLPLLTHGDNEVHALTSRALPEDRSVTWHQVNLLHPDEVRRVVRQVRPEALLHLAWGLPYGRYWHDPANLNWVTATLGLVQTFAEYGGRQAVITGTCAEYDWRYGLCTEDVTPLEPTTLYGAAKHHVHQILAIAANALSINLIWARLFWMYGPYEGSQRLIPSVIRALLRGEAAYCTEGSQIRDYLHVHDVARALTLLLESSYTGAVNIASGKPVALAHLLGLIGQLTDRLALIRFGAIPTPIDEPFLVVGNPRRLQATTSWVQEVFLEEGLQHTIEWWHHYENHN